MKVSLIYLEMMEKNNVKRRIGERLSAKCTKKTTAVREIVNFSNTIFFRQHKWMTKLFFNKTIKKAFFYLQHGILDLLLVLQDSWSLSLLVLRRNGVMRRWEGSLCCRTCEGLCFLHFWRKTCCSCRNWTLDVTVSFVSGIWGGGGESRRYLH